MERVPMERRWLRLSVTLVAAAAISAVGVWSAATTQQDDWVVGYVFDIVIGSSFLAAGAVAAWTRPDNRTGLLMAICGLATIGGAWSLADEGWVFIIGALAGVLGLVAFVHLIAGFPDGMVRRRPERVLVVVGYGLFALILALVPFVETAGVEGCEKCPANPGAIAANETLSLVVLRGLDFTLATALLVLLVLLVVRWRSATAPERRAIAPVLWAAVGASVSLLLAFCLQFVSEWAALPPYLAFILFLFAVPMAFLVGLLRDRLRRSSAMQELVVQLAGARDPEALRATLAATLRDPGLRIAFWYAERATFVDADGHRVEVAERGSTLVERGGDRVAALIHDPSLHDDPLLLEAVAAAATIGLERARLEAELRARVDELRTSRARIVEAGYTARRRLERDLHDGAQQRLVALSLVLRMIRNRVEGDEDALALVDGARTELDAALAELRELARGIHPAILTDRGLEPALRALADRSTVPVDVEVEADLQLPSGHEAAIYFVASEALANVAKHANAAHAAVTVSRQPHGVRVEIVDDGVGGAEVGAGSGLAGLRDRVEALDGRLEVTSPPGDGTRVCAIFPAPRRVEGAQSPTATASA